MRVFIIADCLERPTTMRDDAAARWMQLDVALRERHRCSVRNSARRKMARL